MKADWEALAREVGSLTNSGEMGGTSFGKQAIAHVLGDEFFEQAVDYYIRFQPGFELARSVLSLVKPWSGMQHCYKIFQHSDDLDARQSAIELLRIIADRRVLEWIPEFLADPDPSIQAWGIGVVDQLLFSDFLEDDEAQPILAAALHHQNPYVREQATMLLKPREERNSD
jgi:HEAT repeat protein